MMQKILSLKQAEQRYLEQVSARFTGSNRTLARKLGVTERTLYRKLRELRDLRELRETDQINFMQA